MFQCLPFNPSTWFWEAKSNSLWARCSGKGHVWVQVVPTVTVCDTKQCVCSCNILCLCVAVGLFPLCNARACVLLFVVCVLTSLLPLYTTTNSGKSTEMIRRMRRFRIAKRECLVRITREENNCYVFSSVCITVCSKIYTSVSHLASSHTTLSTGG